MSNCPVVFFISFLDLASNIANLLITCIKFDCYALLIVVFVYFCLQDFEKLANFLQKYYNSTLTKKDLSVRGWNWGISNFIGRLLFVEIFY